MHLLVSALLFSLAAALAQAPSNGFRIAGKVVNADSGAPLSGAEVAIVSVVDGTWGAPNGPGEDQPRRGRGGRGRRAHLPNALQGVTTGDDGSFSFEHVPAGKYSLEGSHRGFITASYQEHGLYSTAIVTGVGVPSDNLTLQLSPGSVIGGNVIDASGDPLEQAQASLYRLSDDGLGTIRMYRSANTDDLGAYEFAHLPPGTYFVSAAGNVWYAQQSRDFATPSASPTNLDVVYPRSFYADATDSNAATPVSLRGGEHLRIDLHMQAVPAVHLTYTVPGQNGSSDRLRAWTPPPTVTQNVFGTAEGSFVSSSIQSHSSPTGEQSLSLSVAPGAYEVDVAGRSLSVNATGDTVLDPQTGTPPVEISGRLGAAAGATLPESVDVLLEPSDARGGSAASTVAHEGSFHFDQVRPGAYEVTAQSGGSPITIVEMAASGGQVDGHVLRVSTQPVSLAATVTPASVILSGFAHAPASADTAGRQAEAGQQDQAASGVMIVLVPQHEGDHALYRRDQSDSDGSFSLRQVAAGTYTLVAIRDGWDLDWARPEVIAHYLPGGLPVTISSSNTGPVHLAKPVIVQDR